MYSREPSNNAKASDDDEEDAFDKEFKVGNPPGRVTCHLLRWVTFKTFQNIVVKGEQRGGAGGVSIPQFQRGPYQTRLRSFGQKQSEGRRTDSPKSPLRCF